MSSPNVLGDTSFQEVLSRSLNLTVYFASAFEPLDEALLDSAGREVLYQLKSPRRRTSWLLGRAALRKLADKMGERTHLDLLRFPHAEVSVSHSRGMAVAVCSPGGTGTGVDVEFLRPIGVEAGRFFLSAPERQHLFDEQSPEMRTSELIRLWTVKEAVFKADLQNEGKTLLRYSLMQPGALLGLAMQEGRQFDYSSHQIADGWLTVSLARS